MYFQNVGRVPSEQILICETAVLKRAHSVLVRCCQICILLAMYHSACTFSVNKIRHILKIFTGLIGNKRYLTAGLLLNSLVNCLILYFFLLFYQVFDPLSLKV